MSASRKNYVTVAALIALERRQHPDDPKVQGVLDHLSNGLAVGFKRDNDSFDRKRFLAAAGVEP